jgi:HNH endonuclease
MSLPLALRSQLVAGIIIRPGPDRLDHWHWVGDHDAHGVPILLFGPPGKKKILKVHRLIFEAFNGEIPLNKSVIRTCSVSRCIRAKHLTLTTHRGALARWLGRPWLDDGV